MALNSLTAPPPLDGRYAGKIAPLRDYFSELGLIRFRVQVEVAWLMALAAEPGIREVPRFSAATIKRLDAIVVQFSDADGARVKIASFSLLGKINGAVGNYNTHLAALPDLDRDIWD